MIDERTLIGIIARSTQDECKQMGDLFLSFASAARDVHWESQMRRTLAMFPDPPQGDLVNAIMAGRERVARHNKELWDEGWHPVQMRQKLEELGHTGNQASDAWRNEDDREHHDYTAAQHREP
jgi:hypothetical protein